MTRSRRTLAAALTLLVFRLVAPAQITVPIAATTPIGPTRPPPPDFLFRHPSR